MSSISKNYFSLLFLQLANYVFPLLTLPWLTRMLGPDGFGEISFATAFCAYFSIFSDYGFNLSATREIAINREARFKRSQIFWVTISTKVILAITGFIVMLLMTLLVEKLEHARVLLIIGYLAVIGSVITPTWYFQGVEKMTVLTTVNIVARCVSLPLIFCLIHSSDDVLSAMFITSGTSLLAGLFSIVAMIRLKQVCWVDVSINDILKSLKNSWYLFISSAAVSFYTTSNTVILGLVASNADVGYFSVAQRLLRVVQSMIAPLSQAVYPRISNLMHYHRERAFDLIKKILFLQSFATMIVSILLYCFAEPLVIIVFGAEYVKAVMVLQWFAPLPFLIGLSNVFGVQTMLPLGMNKVFTKILLASGIVNIIIIFPLSLKFGANGAAVSVLITEFFVTLLMAIFIIRHSIPIFYKITWSSNGQL